MRRIAWRVRDGIRSATVEGVSMQYERSGLGLVLIDTTSEPLVCVSLHAENARQIDAAAYALADLVATLRGME